VKPLNSNEFHREVQNWTAIALELTVWRLCCERLLWFVHYYCKNHESSQPILFISFLVSKMFTLFVCQTTVNF